MNLKDLIPKDKADIETAKKLKGYSYKELEPIIPQLLEWIQDMNWPVSRPVADYLRTITGSLTDEILKILSSRDEIWKYWCLEVFDWSTRKQIDPRLVSEFERLAFNPTQAEIDEGIQELALEIIKERKTLHNSR